MSGTRKYQYGDVETVTPFFQLAEITSTIDDKPCGTLVLWQDTVLYMRTTKDGSIPSFILDPEKPLDAQIDHIVKKHKKRWWSHT